MTAENKPLKWLQTAAELLEKSTCRHEGKPTSLGQGLDALVALWEEQVSDQGAVYWIGNGGSAALVSHMAQDLLNRSGLRSQTFNEISLLTCMANDFGYPEVFRRPLTVFAKPGDILVAVSSSGMSENIVQSAKTALEMDLKLVTLSAHSPSNDLHQAPATLAFHTPTHNYAQAELTHEALLSVSIDCLAAPAPAEK